VNDVFTVLTGSTFSPKQSMHSWQLVASFGLFWKSCSRVTPVTARALRDGLAGPASKKSAFWFQALQISQARVY
jgi:hypothetical protein